MRAGEDENVLKTWKFVKNTHCPKKISIENEGQNRIEGRWVEIRTGYDMRGVSIDAIKMWFQYRDQNEERAQMHIW